MLIGFTMNEEYFSIDEAPESRRYGTKDL